MNRGTLFPSPSLEASRRVRTVYRWTTATTMHVRTFDADGKVLSDYPVPTRAGVMEVNRDQELRLAAGELVDVIWPDGEVSSYNRRAS